MLIAIDFDETLTRDHQLWKKFVDTAGWLNHRVACVTARRDTEENNEIIDEWMRQHEINIPVFYTGLRSKIEYMESKGQRVDIWIDDDPKRLVFGH